MRLFIATTTLNFDAIMATESLSPVSFYERRGFGISLFYPKASFQLKNSILLFDAFPHFKISDQEVEHRQMVIEIDDSNYPVGTFKKVKDNDGFSVYQALSTLYISPLSCKIYFYTERDRATTLSKADSIIEAKYALYKKLGVLEVVDSSLISYVSLNRPSLEGIVDSPDADYKAMDFDRRVDKAKGFLVSYMMGASKAISADSVRLLRLVKDIKNSVYSIGTKEKDVSSPAALASLRTLTAEAETLSRSMDQRKREATMRVYAFLRKIGASEKLNGSSDDAIVSVFKEAGVYGALYQKVNGPVSTFSIESCVAAALNAEDDAKQEEAIQRMQAYARSITCGVDFSAKADDLFAFDPDLRVIDCKDESLPVKSREKLNTLYNLFSGYNVSSAEIRTNRINYVVDAGEALGIADGSQEEKDYFNALLDNLEHAARFDIMSTSDPILQALAGFMRSPDKDIDKMISSLVNSEVADPRAAYGLWGLFHGYSSIRQDYFNAFVKNYKDNKDVAELINQLYFAFFKVTPSFPHIDSESRRQDSSPKEKSFFDKVGEKAKEIGSKFGEFMGVSASIEQLKDEPTEQMQDMPEDVYQGSLFPAESVSKAPSSIHENKSDDDLPSDNASLIPDLQKILESRAPSKPKDKTPYLSYYCRQVSNLCSKEEHIVAIINGLDDIPVLDTGKTAWKEAKPKLKKYLKDVEKRETERLNEVARQKRLAEHEQRRILAEQERMRKIEEQERLQRERIEQEETKRQRRLSMMNSDVKRKLCDDPDATLLVDGLLASDKEACRQVKTDLEWFQGNYAEIYYDKKKGRQPGYYKDYPKDNASVIGNLENYLKRKLEPNSKAFWIAPIYERVDIQALIRLFKQVYSE